MDCQEYRPFLPLFGQTSRTLPSPPDYDYTDCTIVVGQLRIKGWSIDKYSPRSKVSSPSRYLSTIMIDHYDMGAIREESLEITPPPSASGSRGETR